MSSPSITSRVEPIDDHPPNEVDRALVIQSLRQRQRHGALLLAAPWVAGLVLYMVMPLVLSFVVTFGDREIVPEAAATRQWMGLDNWRQLFAGPNMGGILISMRFALLFVPAMVLVPIVSAFAFTSDRLWERSWFRLMFCVPMAVPVVAGMIAWSFAARPPGNSLPETQSRVRSSSIEAFFDRNWLLPLFFAVVWAVGNLLVTYVASLDGVPRKRYEAAALDGASKWRNFRDVTWPMIRPAMFFNVVITLLALGHCFVAPYILQGPAGRLSISFALAGVLLIATFASVLVVVVTAHRWVRQEFEGRAA